MNIANLLSFTADAARICASIDWDEVDRTQRDLERFAAQHEAQMDSVADYFHRQQSTFDAALATLGAPTAFESAIDCVMKADVARDALFASLTATVEPPSFMPYEGSYLREAMLAQPELRATTPFDEAGGWDQIAIENSGYESDADNPYPRRTGARKEVKRKIGFASRDDE